MRERHGFRFMVSLAMKRPIQNSYKNACSFYGRNDGPKFAEKRVVVFRSLRTALNSQKSAWSFSGHFIGEIFAQNDPRSFFGRSVGRRACQGVSQTLNDSRGTRSRRLSVSSSRQPYSLSCRTLHRIHRTRALLNQITHSICCNCRATLVISETQFRGIID